MTKLAYILIGGSFANLDRRSGCLELSPLDLSRDMREVGVLTVLVIRNAGKAFFHIGELF